MPIKWPSLCPWTPFWCQKLCRELVELIKKSLSQYVKYFLRYWHFSWLLNLWRTRYLHLSIFININIHYFSIRHRAGY
jgi:hypothetical protein